MSLHLKQYEPQAPAPMQFAKTKAWGNAVLSTTPNCEDYTVWIRDGKCSTCQEFDCHPERSIEIGPASYRCHSERSIEIGIADLNV